jgi:type I restriction enzyme S subunit
MVSVAEVAVVNPKPTRIPSKADIVAFVGMADLDAEAATAVDSEQRRYAEVATGYTPFERGDLLMAKITPCFENGKIGQAVTSTQFAVGSTEFHVLRPRPERLSDRYLLHFLRRSDVRRYGEARMTGAGGQRRLPARFLDELTIPLPPIEEQRRIAAVLDAADALRARRRQALAKLDVLTHVIFIDMFGDPLLDPKGWGLSTLGEVLTLGPQNGLYKPSRDYGDGVRIIRIDSYQQGRPPDLDSLRRVCATDKEIDAYRLSPDDLIINRVNSRSHLGKATLVPALTGPVLFESNMMRMRLDSSLIHPAYALAFLQTSSARRQILNSCKDAINQSSINQGDVRSIELPLPPKRLQDEFAAVLAQVSSVSDAVKTCEKELDALFASLQQRAFRGNL